MASTRTVAELRANLHHARWSNWVGGAFGTAEEAVTALERLINAEPSEVFPILDELRGGTR